MTMPAFVNACTQHWHLNYLSKSFREEQRKVKSIYAYGHGSARRHRGLIGSRANNMQLAWPPRDSRGSIQPD